MIQTTDKQKQQRIKAVLFLVVIFTVATIISFFAINDAVNKTTENQALSVAEIVAIQAKAARSVYSANVAGKLKKDGTGPHVKSAEKPGYIPIPAQFLKLVGLKSSENVDYLYKYKPVSKWNLEPTQDLSDDFLAWAWPQLEVQDQQDPTGPIQWNPIYRFEDQEGRRVLRYLYADAASQPSCVSCHSQYEQNPLIIKRRADYGVEVGKQWKQYQLLGALSVTIPLDKLEHIADAQVIETSLLIIGILISSFLALTVLNLRLTSREHKIAETEHQLELSEQRRKDADALLLAKKDVENALAELSVYLEGIDQHAMVSVADKKGKILQANDKFLERSGYLWEEIKGKDHSMLKSGVHDNVFFSQLWHTISNGNNWRGEICNKAKDGSLYWVDTSIVPQKNTRGEIFRFISIRIDITERKADEERMRYMGTHDALTGLPNRILFLERIKETISYGRRRNDQAAILFVDLDHFKIINDTLGHDVGDQLLVDVSKRLRNCVRVGDTVARQGGDEFIILLLNIKDSDVSLVAQNLLNTLVSPYQIGDNELHISASVGISIFPNDGEDVETLLKNSDIAMYCAKEKGRNNYKFFTKKMNSSIEEKNQLVCNLRRALIDEQFELYYQPVIDIKTSQVDRFEALIRWNHPQQGLVLPGQFISLAEETGLIVPISNWVLEKCCQQIKLWDDKGCFVNKIAINLSTRQFCQKELPLSYNLQNILSKVGISGKRIELEITEGLLMDKDQEIMRTMKSLNKMGVELSIDDFGTGYSSLSYLKKFPVDTLKIDRSFVSDMSEEGSDLRIIKAIINLSHSLNMKVIAEGVEQEWQLEILKSMSCDLYQGYYFRKPMPADEVEALMSNASSHKFVKNNKAS